jgi:hypothetical protein
VGKTDFSRRLLCIEKEIVGARATYIQEVYHLYKSLCPDLNIHIGIGGSGITRLSIDSLLITEIYILGKNKQTTGAI